MTTQKPLNFTAIIPNYNHAHLVGNTLEAALSQTVPFDEIIIIDDASTDNSVEVITRRIAGYPQVRFIKNQQNMGVVAACNLGLIEAKGEFVYYMSADNDYRLQAVEQCRRVLAAYPDVDMICGNLRIHNVATGTERDFILPFPQTPGCYGVAELAQLAARRAFTFNSGANVLRRSAVLALGLQKQELAWHSDWLLYLLLGLRGRFAVVPYEFLCMRQEPKQYSHACYHWRTQRPVLEAYLHALKADYPQEYDFFRRYALMPTYDVETLALLAGREEFRDFLTPLLAWRLLTYKPMRYLSKAIPQSLRPALRRWMRL